MNITELSTGSIVYGSLPTGCNLCQRGLKSIIFVTGLCPASCFYCPISYERRKDITFINEKKVSNIKEIITEIINSASMGASLTGGDPLARPDRTLSILKELKDFFGPSFHIHLYTSGINLSIKLLKKLEQHGLDELRIHPTNNYVYKKLPEIVKESSIEIGIEIPMMPGTVESTFNKIRFFEKIGIKFVNLNELEFSESNALSLLERGFTMNNDYVTAKNSKEDAIKVIHRVANETLDITVHFCPVIVKDKYQTGLRLFHRGVLTSKPFQKVTDEGTLIHLEVNSSIDIQDALPDIIALKRNKNTYLTSLDNLDLIKKVDKYAKLYIVEELSSYDQLLLEKMEIE